MFEGFTLVNKQKAAEEGLKQADALYRQSLVTSFQNVADALRALQADTKAVHAATHSEQVAKRQLDIVKKQLGVGSVNVLILLNAEQVYLQALVTRVAAEGARMGDVVGLFMALGGDWKDEALKNVKVILTSSEATQKSFDDHKKLKVGRADEYLIKPFTADVLRAKLAKHGCN